MTDKVQKIREEIERIMAEEMSLFEVQCKGEEEPSASSPVVYIRMQMLLSFINSLPEEPVNEDLDKAAKNYAFTMSEEDEVSKYYAFLAGAKWKAELFEKNRLAACDKQTEEEAEVERDFVMGIIEKEHRQPTFDDAIKYGMRLKEKEMQSTIELAEDHAMLAGMEKMKEQMMAKAVDGDITFDYYGDDDKTYGCIAHDSFCLEDFGLKDRDKVKMIIVKDEMS